MGLRDPTSLKFWPFNTVNLKCWGGVHFVWLDPRPIFLHMNLQTQPINLILFFLQRFVLCDDQKNTRTVLEHPEINLLEWCFFFVPNFHFVYPIASRRRARELGPERLRSGWGVRGPSESLFRRKLVNKYKIEDWVAEYIAHVKHDGYFQSNIHVFLPEGLLCSWDL